VSDVWAGVRTLHLLAMAFFVGGQLLLAIAVVPVERHRPDHGQIPRVARRFAWGTLAAIGVLLATGAALATEFRRWGEGTLQVKLAIVALVGILIIWHMRRPELRALDGAIFLTSLAIVWLGVALAH
jgi:putative copper export protein